MSINVFFERPMGLYPIFRCVVMEDSDEIESLWGGITGDNDE